MEPSAQDVNAVAQAMGQTPPQAPQPLQQPPAPTPQPSPQSQQQEYQQPQSPQPTQEPTQAPTDPFASFAPQAPQQPAEPTYQPSEPGTQPQQPQAPQAPIHPETPAAPQYQPQPQTQPEAQPQSPMTVDAYLDGIFGELPSEPSMPDPSKVDPDSPEGIQQFFTDLMTTAEKRFEAKHARNSAIQAAEKKAWEDAFDKYGSLRSNTKLRDMVHAIRMNEFNKGVAITPTEAAERLLGVMQQQYQKGVADNQVVTTIEQTQPTGGSSQQMPTTVDADNALRAVQTGGEQALAQILDQQIKAGRQ